MQPITQIEQISQIPVDVCKRLKGIFCDIDDTLTTEGKLLDVAYKALWDGYRAGLRIVAVTGRPAGWVDHIARMWPVSGVVGENGAFYFWMQDKKMHRYFVQDQKTRDDFRTQLNKLQTKILHDVPGSAISADQRYRESDLAIDFCEDIPPLDRQSIEKIAKIFQDAGAKAKISSIHVNGWFGEFDKLSTCRLLMANLWHESPEDWGRYIYCGDSPNDEPMFYGFPYSVGVANVIPWLSYMKSHPKYCTTKPSSQGFAELVSVILEKRNMP